MLRKYMRGIGSFTLWFIGQRPYGYKKFGRVNRLHQVQNTCSPTLICPFNLQFNCGPKNTNHSGIWNIHHELLVGH